MNTQKKPFREGIIRFEWMGYPVIGLPHFEQRRAERLSHQEIILCSESFANENVAIKFCFKLLEEKHGEIETARLNNMPNNTVFVTGFETDDFDERGKLLWFVMVFSICPKESEMNGVAVGDTSVNLMSTGLFSMKNKTRLEENEKEVVIGYQNNGSGFVWTNSIPRR